MKVHEIWMHDYWNENTSNDIFPFSVSVIEIKFQPIGFLACHFFFTFIQKLTKMLILTLFCSILGYLIEKTINTVWFSIIFFLKKRLSINFMHLRRKLISEICQQVRSLDRKTNQNRLKSPNLPHFSQQTAVFLNKYVKFLL